MHVVELRNPRALFIPDIQQLLKRAVEQGTFLAPAGFDSVAEDLFNFVTDEQQFMLLGAEDGGMKAVILGYLPVGNLFPYPTIVMIYNEGSRQLSRAMQDHLLDLLVSRGYTRMIAVNTSGHLDKVWLRGLTPEGVTSYIAGSLGVFEVE